MSRAHLLFAALGVTALAACDGDGPDAYGNFEADEVTVAAEATGTLQRFDVTEGQRLDAGVVVGQVDTVQLALQRAELELQVRNAGTRSAEARARLRALEAQLATAEEDLARTERLFEREAATASERTRLRGTVSTLREQVEAARAGTRVAGEEADVVRARIDQLEDRIARATVRNPVAGTVLSTVVEAGEYVQQGRPLYTVAALDTLTLRAYLSGGQLAAVRLGDPVGVRYDAPDGGLRETRGRVTWIADRAEFTPTPIQTREERVDQVYGVADAAAGGAAGAAR
jgi:HlyD family secretion protein